MCLRGEHGVCGEWELARFLHVKSTRAAHTQLGEKIKLVKLKNNTSFLLELYG